ncbi:MAG: ribonucleoside-diphosphate reductase subunit alpha [Helicobacteraceae bacterium]|jgi:ribonucleoside-diphosphate reductase alpha chain|nr:ribonucleoside-diphosphate reductase subunit alpha [Helicobacteraceae bacterium]
MITVIKRDGRREALEIAKIQKFTADSVAGLNNVDQSELELDAKLQFRDGISTADIQQTLIHTAADKIDVDRPDWTFVAARLFIYDLYHRVGKATMGVKGQAYLPLRRYFEVGEREGRILKGLGAKYDLDDLGRYIKPERDYQFTYLGIKTLYDRYLLKNRNNEPIELPQQMFMAVAMFLAQNEADRQGWAKKFYDVLSKFEVMAATPTLSNARTPRHQLSSCFVGSTPDNIEGIFDGYKEMALLSKYGGGVGWDWSKVRSGGSFIDGHKNAAGGVVPFLKITNDLAVAVDQLGTRKGAIAVYIEPWHKDVLDFLDLRKNSGEERRRTHDIFPALWICDLFMKRIESDGDWALFDPFNVPDLTDLYGEAFENAYIAYEADRDIPRIYIKAKDLWKKILLSYFETGMPFLCFKDAANESNPNNHVGTIRSSNLCTEIFQNTAPNEYAVRIMFDDGGFEERAEEDTIATDEGVKKPANKISSLDTLQGRKVYAVEKVARSGLTAVCNLASVNLARINTKEEIERVTPIAVRMLDNVIDLNFYPLAKVKATNLKTRAIGLGVMGETEFLATRAIEWGGEEHLRTIDEIMETISYNAINASCDLAVEKGAYENYEGSKWSRGVMPIDAANKEALKLVDRGGLFGLAYDWEELREKVRRQKIRNGHLLAIAPTSSISILIGTTQAIEPIYKRKWFEENLSGMIAAVAPKLTPETWNYYTPAYELDQTLLVKAAAIRQKWIDQGQSLNLFFKIGETTGKRLSEVYQLAWKLGLKSVYYLRSESPEFKDEAPKPIDRSVECDGCQ